MLMHIWSCNMIGCRSGAFAKPKRIGTQINVVYSLHNPLTAFVRKETVFWIKKRAEYNGENR